MPTDERVVQACPRCNSPDVHEREIKRPLYRCYDCGKEFAEPLERPPRSGIPILDGLDPEDVGLSPLGERDG